MKVTGLDGKVYSFNLKKTQVDDDNQSSFHLKVRKLIEEVFPQDMYLEELVLPGSNGLRADFILPLRRLIVEVHGQQHYQYTPYFHKSLKDYGDAKQRDTNKIHWARLNKFFLLELDTRDESDWQLRLRDFFKYNRANSSNNQGTG